ncbi:DUF2491 family protein [Desulfobacterales bacterium HSG16]|nr:DUF2491 family protein [Desulfobacterales bacterium HSG16]
MPAFIMQRLKVMKQTVMDKAEKLKRRIDHDAPFGLGIGAIVEFNELNKAFLGADSLIADDIRSIPAQINIKAYGRMEMDTTLFHRFYFENFEGQEFFIQVITDPKGRPIPGEIKLFTLYVEDSEYETDEDYYLADGDGLIGYPMYLVPLRGQEGIEEPETVEFWNMWKSREEWEPPEKIQEDLYTNPRRGAYQNLVHVMGFFGRETGEESQEWAFLSAVYTFWPEEDAHHDLSVATYIGLDLEHGENGHFMVYAAE